MIRYSPIERSDKSRPSLSVKLSSLLALATYILILSWPCPLYHFSNMQHTKKQLYYLFHSRVLYSKIPSISKQALDFF